MDRTKAIFDWIFGIGEGYELYYLSSDNIGLTQEGLHARREHEANGARTVQQKLAPSHTTMQDVWAFLNQQHDLYTASKLASRARSSGISDIASSALKESYGGYSQRNGVTSIQ